MSRFAGRPANVWVACGLLLATAVLLVFDALLTWVVSGPIHGELTDLYAPPPGELVDPLHDIPPDSLWPLVGTTLPGGVTLAFVHSVAALGIADGWRWVRYALAFFAVPAAALSALCTVVYVGSPLGGELTSATIIAAKHTVPLWIQVIWVVDGYLYPMLILAATVLVWASGRPTGLGQLSSRPPVPAEPPA